MPDSSAYAIVRDLYLRNRNFCSSDYDACLDYLNKLLPLKLHTFKQPDPYKGWVVPPKWDLVKALIRFQGNVIFEVTHPLQIIGLSTSFHGTVSREELRTHLHYDHRDPNSTPYHFRQHYRPWERDWGFCVPRTFYDGLQPGLYEVEIITRESTGYLHVAEHTHVGQHPETFVFVAHLDHPGMANDDLAGVAVGVELFRRLSQKSTKFSYRLLLVQEIIGSIFYLGQVPGARAHVLESCFLEMLGTNTELALQHSRRGDSQLERCIQKTLDQRGIPHRAGPFRSVICNDEIIWESYQIPMASLSRFPYPEYHSDKDNLSIISPEALEESVQILQEAIAALDASTLMRKQFEGVLALSHPSYQLYVDPGQPAFGSITEEKTKKLRLLMDLIPMYPDVTFVEKMADDTQLPVEDVMDYLRLWANKKLIMLQ